MESSGRGIRIPASARTLAEILKGLGYDTALFSAHPLVGPLSGLDQGFDWIEEIPGPFGPAPPTGPAETSATLNRRILAWLDARKSPAPTFIVALSGDPLEPFGAPGPEGGNFLPQGEYEWYSNVRRKLQTARPGNLGLATPGDLQRLKVDPARFAQAARNLYDGALLYNDRQLGALKEELEARGYWKNALFLVTSTHGEEFGERGTFGHGATLYDTALRVPVVISFPPVVPTPRQMRRTCDTVDLLPTLLSMLGFPLPEGVQGIERNVEPTLQTRRQYNRPAFAETSPAGELPTGRACMIGEDGTKLILHEESPAGIEEPELELFRSTDPKGWEQRSALLVTPPWRRRSGRFWTAGAGSKGPSSSSPIRRLFRPTPA